MAIPASIVRQIRDAAKIEEVLGEFLTLKKRGKDYVSLCPFHAEKTPSFYVSPTKGIFKCFGCGKGGDVITFLQEHEQMTYVEALRYLARKYGIEIPEEVATEEVEREEQLRKQLISLMQYAHEYYRKQLRSPQGRGAVAYLRNRGVGADVTEHFQLGLALPDERLSEHLARLGTDPALIEAAGLGRRKENRWQDVFRARLIFPIFSLGGQPIAFAGRILRAHTKAPKYLNSPDTPLFTKSETLYGLYQARSDIRARGYAVVVEGYFDVMALYRAGYANAVAPMGTSLTEHQLRRLYRFTDRVVFLMDNDRAGREATLKGFEKAAAVGFRMEAVRMPEGEDPDSLLQKEGKAALEAAVEQRMDFVEFVFRVHDMEDPDEKARAVRRALTIVAGMPDAIRQAAYLEKIVRQSGIPRDAIDAEFGRIRREVARQARVTSSVQVPPGGDALPSARLPSVPPMEWAVITLALQHGEAMLEDRPVLLHLEAQLGDSPWESSTLEALWKWLLGYYHTHHRLPPAQEVMDHADPQLHPMLADVWLPPRPSEQWQKQPGHAARALPLSFIVDKAVSFFRIHQYNREVEALQAEISRTASVEARQRLYDRLHETKRKIDELSRRFDLSVVPPLGGGGRSA